MINKNINKTEIKKNFNDNFIVDVINLSLAGSNNNPFEKIIYFNNKSNEVSKITLENNSFIITENKSETIIRLYAKNKAYVEAGIDLWNKLNFMKTTKNC